PGVVHSGQHDNRRPTRLRKSRQVTHELKPGAAYQIDVAQDQVDRLSTQSCFCLIDAGGLEHLVPLGLQAAPKRPAQAHLVVEHQQSSSHQRSLHGDWPVPVGSSIPRSQAKATASSLEWTPSLESTLCTWLRTVLRVTPSVTAISLFGRPWETRRRTSHS